MLEITEFEISGSIGKFEKEKVMLPREKTSYTELKAEKAATSPLASARVPSFT
jgi:hypothetical protein